MMLRAAIIPPDEVLQELRRAGGSPRQSATDVWDVQVAGFGNVSEADARRLGRVLADELAAVPAPVMWFTAPRLEDGEIIAPLEGQVEEMAELARIVHRLASSVNLYVDRRRFRPVLTMASLEASDGAQPPAPAAVPRTASPTWAGMPWEAGGVSLVRTRWSESGGRAEELMFIELGHPVDHSVAPG
ncbi:MAG TPA: hypothetical protein VNS81_12265 [Nocardioides sp.]|nr:hypothetical protein [Nocardioides sp.]